MYEVVYENSYTGVREFVLWRTRTRTKSYENRIFVILLRNPDLRELRKSYENVIPSVIGASYSSCSSGIPFSPQNLSISSSFFSRGRRKKEGEKEGEY